MNTFCTDNPDVIGFEPRVFSDERGFFMESYRRDKFHQAGIPHEFVQDNHSFSIKGTLRGLHYQISHVQGKLVRVTSGEIFDAAVDLRKSSPNFGKWVGLILSAENKKQLWIPPGFAHGFYTLSPQADVLYKTTDYYDPAGDRCLIWNDPVICITWPLDPQVPLLLSEKDKQGTSFKNAEVFE
ncbi:MAG: dTDP-4-dehydrorhamnose 3,5-epimerase [Pelolinea sp.]|nr:dTDP-4-dehydrorhamnose 3,5-epimerase [Pelolinea sp.]